MMLNESQDAARLHTEGPLLILAGAGAGKTKTLIERMCHIISNGTSPRHILAVTFTNKAAKEMQSRILSRLSALGYGENPYDTPLIKTFHGLGLLILREFHAHAQLPKYPVILDAQDQLSTIKRILEELSIDPKLYEPTMIRGTISRHKGDFISRATYAETISNSKMDVIATVWRRYEEILIKEHALDYDDLICKAVTLLKEHASVRAILQKRYTYIHIDEYQDTNEAQYEFAKLLVDPLTTNICAVGDIDQNIYSWRGANIKNIMHFEKDFPGTKTVLLEENYRSTTKILSLANRAIAKNKMRVEKNLYTNQGEGEKINILSAYDEYSEAENIAYHARALITEGTRPDHIAVLFRANFQSRVLEEAMLKAGVPYLMLGTRFFERKEVKDIMSYIRASLTRASFSDMKRVFDTPKKGIGKTTVAKYAQGEPLTSSQASKIQAVHNFLDNIEVLMHTEPLSHVIQHIIVQSGLEKELREGGPDDLERLENVRELVSLTISYDSQPAIEVVEKFLEDASLMSDQDNDTPQTDGVRLMTIHASKGLEFDAVFIAGLEQDLFPHKRFGSPQKKGSKEEDEEERRLFYVAVTRARKFLFLSYAEVRTIYGQKQVALPSEFLDDIEPEDTEIDNMYYKTSRFQDPSEDADVIEYF